MKKIEFQNVNFVSEKKKNGKVGTVNGKVDDLLTNSEFYRIYDGFNDISI